jgi:hypothetical protein
MSVSLDGEIIRLVGRCHVEDAEPLLVLLQAGHGRTVDLSGSEMLHTAIVQLILAFRPPLAGDSAEGFVKDWVLPAIKAGGF